MKRFYSLILLTLIMLLSLPGCVVKDDMNTVDLSLFETMHEDGEWAVVTEPYVAFRERPEPSSNVAAHGRLGDIVQIQGKSLVPDEKQNASTLWYLFEEGYVSSSSVVVYSNRLQAQTAAANLSQDN